jgi:hypothetical protein
MNKKIICKIAAFTAIVCIALMLHSCDKDGYMKCFNNMVCDINGEAYEDQDKFLFPFGTSMTPCVNIRSKNDSCTIIFYAICRPTKNKESLHTYEINIKINGKTLPLGGKYEISSSILDKGFKTCNEAIMYCDTSNISYVEVYDDSTDKNNLGDGYFEITSRNNKDSYYLGEVNIKVKLPIQNADSTLNIKGKFRIEFKKPDK